MRKLFIYKIFSTLNPNTIYIGSTFSNINQRFSRHKYSYIHNLQNCRTKEIFNTYDLNTCIIEPLETFFLNPDVVDVDNEKRKIERLYFDKYKLDTNYILINKNRPMVYEDEKKQYMKEFSKEWYNKNRNDKIKSSLLNYYKKKCNSKKIVCPNCNHEVYDFYLSKHSESERCKNKGLTNQM
jgi:hypothetical protein